MAVLTRTHTKTYALMYAWASTTPHECDAPCDKLHAHVGDVCAVGDCDEHLRRNEVCYAVVELPDRTPAGGEQWVCWRHVRPDDGPIRI